MQWRSSLWPLVIRNYCRLSVEKIGVPASGEFTASLRLADFLSDPRNELDEARSRSGRWPLQLEVTEIAVSLDVGVTFKRRCEASASAHSSGCWEAKLARRDLHRRSWLMRST